MIPESTLALAVASCALGVAVAAHLSMRRVIRAEIAKSGSVAANEGAAQAVKTLPSAMSFEPLSPPHDDALRALGRWAELQIPALEEADRARKQAEGAASLARFKQQRAASQQGAPTHE